MNEANQRTALAAIERARPAVSRLDLSRDPEDNAADLLESWGAVETALRALVGGTGLGGQSLIRELRTREVVSFDTGRALVEFLAARDRANGATYRPTMGDIEAAREGVQRLESGLLTASVGVPVSPTAATVVSTPAADPHAAAPAGAVHRRSLNTRVKGVPAWAVLVLLLASLAGLGAVAWRQFAGGGEPAAFRRGVEAYAGGRREAARAEFEAAIRADSTYAPAHVYLGRVAREMGDMPTASRALQSAVRLDPQSAVAQREMGSFLLANNNPALARNFYVRALQLDPADRSAMGFLACALTRINRPDLAQTWYQRAGQGAWSGCAAARPTMPGQVPGQMPGQMMPPQPGLVQPGAYPPPPPAYPQPAPQVRPPA